MSQVVPAQAHAGVLVIHGVGTHARTSTLKGVLDPFLSRLDRENLLIDVTSWSVGTDEELGGKFEALTVTYRTHDPAFELTKGKPQTRTLFAVEGIWSGIFEKSSATNLLTWAGTHAIPMTWELLRYHAKSIWPPSLLLLASLFGAGVYSWRSDHFQLSLGLVAAGLMIAAVTFALDLRDARRTARSFDGWLSVVGAMGSVLLAVLLGAGVYVSRGHHLQLSIGLIAVGMLIAVITAFLDVRDAASSASSIDGWFSVAGAVATLTIYQLQRGLVIIVTFMGIFVLPVVAMSASWLASIPFLAQLGVNVTEKIQSLLLNGGTADMEAVSNNFITASEITTRLRGALEKLEQGVRKRGTITVVAHSGGCLPAWSILSDTDIVERQKKKVFRYRLITVAAALNWAMRGFDSHATRIDGPLVHHEADDKSDRTFWLNVYSSWDPVPHGPAPVFPEGGSKRYYKGWETWDNATGDERRGTPNRLIRNLGAPVADEHGEYWHNQQEFIPLLARAIDSDIRWAQASGSVVTTSPGDDQQLWSNIRLALLGGLVRARLIILALPAGALAAAASGRRFLTCDTHPIHYGSAPTRWLGKGVQWAGEHVLGKGVYGHICGSVWLEGAIVAVALTLGAYALMGVYTNFFWQSLGRRVTTIRPHPSTGWFASPWLLVCIVWLPTIVFPLLLFPFGLPTIVWMVFLLGNLLLALLEVLWLNACLRAFGDPVLRPVCSAAIGRQRLVTQQLTPAGPAAV